MRDSNPIDGIVDAWPGSGEGIRAVVELLVEWGRCVIESARTQCKYAGLAFTEERQRP